MDLSRVAGVQGRQKVRVLGGLAKPCLRAYPDAGAIVRGRVSGLGLDAGEGGGTPAGPQPLYHPLGAQSKCACVTNKLEAP